MNDPLVRSELNGDVLILMLIGDHLDAGNSNAFRTQTAPLIKPVQKVILDLTGVNFIDSAGLGAILSIMRNLGERGGDLKICCVSKPIKLLFELVRLHNILNIHETREAALASGESGKAR